MAIDAPPVRLYPTPASAVAVCKQAQRRARGPILCPARLPRATAGRPLPRLRAEYWLDESNPRFRAGVSFSYGTPVEPTPHWPAWRRNVWRNRPCCFLHFLVYRRRDAPRFLPPDARPAVVAGRRGLLRPASGYGLRGTTRFYWANHVWFAWHERGVPYVASLHYFGRGTRLLLARLIRELRPARDL